MPMSQPRFDLGPSWIGLQVKGVRSRNVPRLAQTLNAQTANVWGQAKYEEILLQAVTT